MELSVADALTLKCCITRDLTVMAEDKVFMSQNRNSRPETRYPRRLHSSMRHRAVSCRGQRLGLEVMGQMTPAYSMRHRAVSYRGQRLRLKMRIRGQMMYMEIYGSQGG